MLFDNVGLGTAIFNIIISGVNGLINMLFSPIFSGLNNVMTSFFGNLLLSPVLLNFYNVLNGFVIPYLRYFLDLIPPLTFDVIILALDFFILVHAWELTVGIIFKALRLIKEFVPLA